MNDDPFDYKMGRCVALAVAIPLCVIVLTIGSCTFATTASNNSAIASAIAGGAPPIAAYCAIRGSYNEPACTVTAARQP